MRLSLSGENCTLWRSVIFTVDAERSLCPTGSPNPVTKQPNPAELGTTTEANHE